MRCIKLVHAGFQDRLELEQQRYLSLVALQLLTEIILFWGRQFDLRNAARPTCDSELCPGQCSLELEIDTVQEH
jgi:hypothetical protein